MNALHLCGSFKTIRIMEDPQPHPNFAYLPSVCTVNEHSHQMLAVALFHATIYVTADGTLLRCPYLNLQVSVIRNISKLSPAAAPGKHGIIR